MAVTKVRSSALARAFLLANLAASAASLRVPLRSGAQTEEASAGVTPRRLVAAASSGAGQVMFLQGVALGGMARYVPR